MAYNLFGTDGIRCATGQDPLSLEDLPRLGKAIAVWALNRYGTSPKIVLGHDTRVSCHFVKSALKSGLLLYPLNLYDGGTLPTPALCQLTRKKGLFDCGIIISASHNAYQDNGIKIIDQLSGKISLADELAISALFKEQAEATTTYSSFGSCTILPNAEEQYIEALQSFFEPHFLQGKKVVLDCAHGATYKIAPRIFELLGATVIALHNEPNGTNINDACGALHTQDLQAAVIAHHADVGFAFDGDGDRVIAVSKDGVIKDGDDILALLLDHPHYKNISTLIGTIMTNCGLAPYLAQRSIQLVRTPVGDKYIAEQLNKKNLLLGGEQSGHIIMRDYLDTGDGIFTALRILETLVQTSNWHMTTFDKYPQILINAPVTQKRDLSHPDLAAIIEQGNSQLNAGRLVVRYSGTENVLRIMIEDDELVHAQRIGAFVLQALQKELSTYC